MNALAEWRWTPALAAFCLSLAAAVGTSARMTGTLEERVRQVERAHDTDRSDHAHLESCILERLRGIELGLAELKAEQKILHQR